MTAPQRPLKLVPGTGEEYRRVHNRTVVLKSILEPVVRRGRLYQKLGEIALPYGISVASSLMLLTSRQPDGAAELLIAGQSAYEALLNGMPRVDIVKSPTYTVTALSEHSEAKVLDRAGTFHALRDFTLSGSLLPQMIFSINTRAEAVLTDRSPHGTWVAADWEYATVRLPAYRTLAEHSTAN